LAAADLCPDAGASHTPNTAAWRGWIHLLRPYCAGAAIAAAIVAVATAWSGVELTAPVLQTAQRLDARAAVTDADGEIEPLLKRSDTLASLDAAAPAEAPDLR
jgi:hypothetical protein